MDAFKEAITPAVTAFVESNFATSKFLDLIKVAMEALFAFIAGEI